MSIAGWAAIALLWAAGPEGADAPRRPDRLAESPAAPPPSEAQRLMVPQQAGRQAESAPFDLPVAEEAALADPSVQGLQSWFGSLGVKRSNELFGELVLRAARLVLGRPYASQIELPGVEVVDYNVGVFQCVSLVEGSLAMARCTWLDERTPACFRKEVARLRYRHGAMDGFGSRLHYFEDWLEDNDERGSVTLLTGKLSRHTLLRRTAYMSHHPDAFPSMRDANERRRIADVERRLSHRPVPIVLRGDVPTAAAQLIDGDIVAIATRRPDILIRHVGFVDRDSRGVIHLVHASSARGKVVRTHETLSDYLARRPEREGVLIARPNAPKRRP